MRHITLKCKYSNINKGQQETKFYTTRVQQIGIRIKILEVLQKTKIRHRATSHTHPLPPSVKD